MKLQQQDKHIQELIIAINETVYFIDKTLRNRVSFRKITIEGKQNITQSRRFVMDRVQCESNNQIRLLNELNIQVKICNLIWNRFPGKKSLKRKHNREYNNKKKNSWIFRFQINPFVSPFEVPASNTSDCRIRYSIKCQKSVEFWILVCSYHIDSNCTQQTNYFERTITISDKILLFNKERDCSLNERGTVGNACMTGVFQLVRYLMVIQAVQCYKDPKDVTYFTFHEQNTSPVAQLIKTLQVHTLNMSKRSRFFTQFEEEDKSALQYYNEQDDFNPTILPHNKQISGAGHGLPHREHCLQLEHVTPFEACYTSFNEWIAYEMMTKPVKGIHLLW